MADSNYIMLILYFCKEQYYTKCIEKQNIAWYDINIKSLGEKNERFYVRFI